MSNVFGRIVGKVVVAGAGAVSRAVVQAYRQAVYNAKASRAAGKSASAAVGAVLKTSRSGIPVDDARKILNVKEDATEDEVIERFEKLFDNNSKENGGSFYIQSKVFRAHESLLEDIRRRGMAKEDSGDGDDLPKAPPDANK